MSQPPQDHASPGTPPPLVPPLEKRWQAFLNELDRRDGCVMGHSENVCRLAVQIGRTLALAEAELALVATGALMHDIGKVFIQSRVLAKPTRLSASEWETIRLHPALGEALLTANLFEEAVLDIVRWHHERWDGRGYPDGLGGASIPLYARIVAAADAFSAMRESRPYRAALYLDDAMEELERTAWTQLDGDCVGALLDSLDSRDRRPAPSAP